MTTPAKTDHLAKALEAILQEEEIIEAKRKALDEDTDIAYKAPDPLIAEMKALAKLKDPDKFDLDKAEDIMNRYAVLRANVDYIIAQHEDLVNESKNLSISKESIRRQIRERTKSLV